jgi:hypothetical protein
VDACRGSGILPGKPDPAEAGTPDQRYLDEKRKLYTAVDACMRQQNGASNAPYDYDCLRQRSPGVPALAGGCLPGQRHPVRKA